MGETPATPGPGEPAGPAPGTVVTPDAQPVVRHAPRYKVLIHNDDVTPMET